MKGCLTPSGTQETIRRKPYTPDLTDGQWELIETMLVLPEGGRPRTTDMREVFNGIFYQLRTGWMNNFRGLGKHYDHDSRTGEAKILQASIFYMTKRLTSPPSVPTWSLENEN